MSNHTPGPWRNSDGYLEDIYDAGGQHLFRSVRRDLSGVEYLEQKANARLIAAAPELLEAAQLAAKTLTEFIAHGEGVVACTALLAAIAKAEGSE